MARFCRRFGAIAVLVLLAAGCGTSDTTSGTGAPPPVGGPRSGPGGTVPVEQSGWSITVGDELRDLDHGALTYQITTGSRIVDAAHPLAYGDDALLTVHLQDVGHTDSGGTGKPADGWQAWPKNVPTNAEVALTHECVRITCSAADPAPQVVVTGNDGVFTWNLHAGEVGDGSVIKLTPVIQVQGSKPFTKSVDPIVITLSVHKNLRYWGHLAAKAGPYVAGSGVAGTVLTLLRKRIIAWWRRRRGLPAPVGEPAKPGQDPDPGPAAPQPLP